MPQISEEVLEQLQQAQTELAENLEEQGPLVVTTGPAQPAADAVPAAAGTGPAQHMLLDHSFNGTSQGLWAYAGNGWRYHSIGTAEEQGAVQVVFMSDRVDVWWNASNTIELIRCWKSF